jgi:hypothetical protein
MGGICSTHDGNENYIQNFDSISSERKKPLERPKKTSEESESSRRSIKRLGWIKLAQDRHQWWALEQIREPYGCIKLGDFLTS